MRIVICDDLKEEREVILEYLRRLEKEDNLELEIACFESAEALIASYRSGKKADVLFLDVYMAGITGVAAAKILSDEGYTGSVVFCTTSLDHAVESYRLKADGYLVKPFSYEDFLDAIWRCRKRFDQSKKCLTFVSDRLDCSVPFKEIIYISTEGKGSAVHTEDKSMFTWKRLCDFEKPLQEEKAFLKMGKSFIINMNTIDKVTDDTVIFKNGEEITIPVRENKKIRQMINDYFWTVAREGR